MRSLWMDGATPLGVSCGLYVAPTIGAPGMSAAGADDGAHIYCKWEIGECRSVTPLRLLIGGPSARWERGPAFLSIGLNQGPSWTDHYRQPTAGEIDARTWDLRAQNKTAGSCSTA